ncbi:MAG: hypothetical protein AAFY11_02525 [Cyanobacteria bacterium J06641_5]
MFAYQDPTGSGLLESQGAIDFYRSTVDDLFRRAALRPNSAFTLLEAFEGLTPEQGLEVATVPWLAFPRLANQPFDAIDADRFRLQEEYIEWQVEVADGRVTRVTFTTEFPEYYEALARVSTAALVTGIQAVIPSANPTNAELYGVGFDPQFADGRSRAARFRRNLRNNPWNNGEKGVLCLGHPVNTLGALVGLLEPCAIPNRSIPASAICMTPSCVPGRNSDPVVCQAAQELAREPRGLSLQDPPGIEILRLVGLWQSNGQAIDINNPAVNQGIWSISRNGHRAVLNVSPGLTISGAPITSGAQVAAQLQVGASVVSAPEAVLPDWAKTGEESSRMLTL